VNAKQIWQTAIERLRTRVTAAVFTTWFQGTSALSFQEGVFVICVPTTFAKEQLESRFIELIRSTLNDITGKNVEVRVEVTKDTVDPVDPVDPAADTTFRPPKRSYRISKARLSSALRSKRVADAAEAMNSLATPAAAPANAYRDPQEEYSHPYQQKETNQRTRYYTELDSFANEETQRIEQIKPQEYNPPISTMEGSPNPRYTFGSFIVGQSNKLAHAASLAVAENPGQVYNPLFLYGGVGLGKTHLLHAIGHSGETSGLNVLYTTSEKFTNEIINAIRFQKTEEFRSKYRQIDILLVDDIQFIAGKESTEEEFFHTFNTLHIANKQIVVTSDRPPKAINSLQDRLRSRFEWGLLADVQPPEYEHRTAILRSKSESLRFSIPAGVIEYIARPTCSSVRELEGALNRVIAYATLHDAPLSVKLAAQALEHIYDKKPPANLTVSEVFDGVCRYYNAAPELVRGKQRDRDIVWPRQVAMYLMREETTASLLQIGAALGGRDHTTIMHGWEKVNAEINNNERVRQEIAAVLESLHNRSF
jgi:chromosomal replication initiator protein